MKLLAVTVGLIPMAVLALNYDAELPYADSAPDRATEVSVGILTEKGILEGNPDGYFYFNRLLNRAEFMQIAMRILNPFPLLYPDRGCFPDVHPDAWFSEPVCRAKNVGIVHGNAREGVDPRFWYFEPSRSVQYEEAVKVLVNLYGIPTDHCFDCMEEWYEPFLRAADERGLSMDLVPGHKLTRGQVSRLVARFVAYSEGELTKLLDAEKKETEATKATKATEDVKSRGDHVPLRDTKDNESLESSDSSVPSVAFSSYSPVSSVYDPDPDTDRKSQFILLGTDSPALAAVEIFPESEPLDLTKITVIFTSSSSLTSAEALKVYDQDGKFLGRASKDSSAGNRHYVLNMKHGTWVIPKMESRHVYVRAITRDYRSGGVSGGNFEVDDISVEGSGAWSNRSYSQGSTDDFPGFETSQSIITSISNAGLGSDLLISGNDVQIGSFRFDGKSSGGTSELMVTDIVFTIGVNDGAAVSNVTMGIPGTTDRHVCSVAGSTITCSSIPDSFGTFKSAPKTLILYGDVAVPATAERPSLQVQISRPGSISSAGDITWTDGASTFQWVPFGSPVVRGTYYSW